MKGTGEGRGGKRQRSPQERVDRADRNWLRSQSYLLLTMNSVASLSPPRCPRRNLTCSFEPSYPCYPHSPSRSPGPPQWPVMLFRSPLVLIYSSFTRLHACHKPVLFPQFSPAPGISHPHVLLTLHTQAFPKHLIPRYNSTKLPYPLDAKKKHLLCARQYLKPLMGK